ncbi:carboxymuconolactone decarboxylase family protein [Halorarius litoreus]|uniref:carboxymuconolactone decarboxylase family protein n=1 Tax=Halorarius litoreus TaxID=2962676 RepID=UPI0020CED9E7|nr:carboxymuconolactone decarboxylase family protein [Halorarius litoreus]
MVPRDDDSDESPPAEDERTYLADQLADLRHEDPAFYETYRGLSEHPWESGSLDPRIKELVNVALASATTALYEPAVREHVGRALDVGATYEELLAVLELVSILGMHSATVGYPILVEEADEPPAAAGSESSERIVDELEETRAFFSAVWDDVVAIIESDPDYWEHLYDFLRHPYDAGVLDPVEMEFLYIAIDAGTSHLYTAGLTVHVRNALRLGATPEEIGEVLQLASTTGIHTVAAGLPLLQEEAAKRGLLPDRV